MPCRTAIALDHGPRAWHSRIIVSVWSANELILSALVFVLGFCCAALAAVLLVPFVWRRAVRLTRRRLEATLPLSLKDIRADRDQLRAEFALERRRIEQELEASRQVEAEVRAENGIQFARIDSLNRDIAYRDALVDDLEDETATQRAAIEAYTHDVGEVEVALANERVENSDNRATIERLTDELAKLQAEADSRRVEVVAIKTQSDNLRSKVAERDAEVSELKLRVEEEQTGRRTNAAKIATLERVIQTKDRELERNLERVERNEEDSAGIIAKLREELEDKSAALRDLQSQITVQGAEAVRQGKRSKALDEQMHLATQEIARLETILAETEKRAASEIEQASRALEREHKQRVELAREVARLKGEDEPPEEPAPFLIRPFEIRQRAQTGIRRFISDRLGRAQDVERTTESRPNGNGTGDTGKGDAEKAGPAVRVENGSANAGPTHRERLSDLKSGVSGAGSSVLHLDGMEVAGQNTASGDATDARDPELQTLSDGELRSRIRDLADRLSVFETDDGMPSEDDATSPGQSLRERVQRLKERAEA